MLGLMNMVHEETTDDQNEHNLFLKLHWIIILFVVKIILIA